MALQIQTNYTQLNSIKNNRSVILIGGANIKTQISDLRRGATVVVATPGRLLDLAERGVMNLSHVEVLVLDEADRMLDMGFLPAIRKVLSLVRKKTDLLFSATLFPRSSDSLIVTMKEPKLVEVSKRASANLVEQTAYQVAAESKTALLLDLLERESFERVLVFARRALGGTVEHILCS